MARQKPYQLSSSVAADERGSCGIAMNAVIVRQLRHLQVWLFPAGKIMEKEDRAQKKIICTKQGQNMLSYKKENELKHQHEEHSELFRIVSC